MTSPYTFSEALQLVESTVDDTTLVTNFVANTSTVPPGVAMIEADINLDFSCGLMLGVLTVAGPTVVGDCGMWV